MVRKASVVVVGVALALLPAGCGKSPPPIVEAEGTVLLDGKPLNKAQVRFIPVDGYGAEYMASGVTDEEGRFQLTCHGRPGACACDHVVLVTETDIPPRLQGENAQAELAKYFESLGGRPIPPIYGNLTESPLTASVTAGQKQYNFELTR
jgi:hypothetical protein